MGFSESFQIFRVEISSDGPKTSITTSSIGIFDTNDYIDEFSNVDVLSIPSTINKENQRELSSCSIRTVTNKTESYVADLIVIPDKHNSEDMKILIAFSNGLVLSCQVYSL